MKSNKKIISILTVLLCVGVLLTVTGCEQPNPKPTASESGKFFFNLLLKHDTTETEKFGMTAEQAERIVKAQTDAIKNQTKANFAKSGLSVSDQQLDDFTEAQNNALKLLDATVEASSENGDEVTVTITTPYIDFTAIDTKARTDAIQSVKAIGITDQKEEIEKFGNKYIENTIAGLKDAKLSSETNKGTYKFIKDAKLGFWVPEMDAAKLSGQLSSLTNKKN